MKIGRNEPCPCGSGHKYKLCCLKKRAEMSPRAKLIAVLAGVALIGIIISALLAVIHGARNLDDPSAGGRVWSEEHQHWHQDQ